MKTKKFFMTSLLVMGMIIAKAANDYPPELVLVSQPVLTYNSNSVTIYYDVQNIGDYTYRGDLCIYLDPDNGYCYASEYMKIRAGAIKRIEVTIPAYRPNPSVTYTVMPYYELYDELYSFTTFEYFEPIRFCWYGYHNEPWVVIHVGPRPHYYDRPGDYRFFYDGYHPMMHPAHPDRPLPPADPIHHTYGYHHDHGGYPANYHPDSHVPGYNPPGPKPNDNPGGPGHNGGPGHSDNPGNPGGPGHNGNPGNNGGTGSNGNSGATVVHPNGSHTPGSMSSSGSSGNTVNNNSGATSRPSSGNSGTVSRPSSGNSGTVSRPSSGNSNSGSTSRPSSGNSGTVSRPSSGNSSSGRTGNSSSSGSGRSSNSNSSSSSRGSSSSSGSSSRSSSGSTRGR